MRFDLAAVDWPYVAVLAVFAFIAALAGISVIFGRQVIAATIAALVFAGLFLIWTYYPHRVPGPRALKTDQAPASITAPAPPATPPVAGPPRNPVQDITPGRPPR